METHVIFVVGHGEYVVKKVVKEKIREVCCSDRERVVMPIEVECLLNVGSRGTAFLPLSLVVDLGIHATRTRMTQTFARSAGCLRLY